MRTPPARLVLGASPTSIVPDGPVKFAVCAEMTEFRKLRPAEMQDVFTNRRFGDGVKPGPAYWAIYQSNYYWIVEPHANSANVENVALSAGVITGGEAKQAGCGTPDARQLQNYQALWIYYHRVVAMRADAGVLTVVVEPRPGSREDVQFPDPALPRSMAALKSDGPSFTGLRVVDTAGHVLALRGTGASWWEFDDGGAVVSGRVSAFGPTTLTLRTAADLELFCARGGGTLTFTSANRPPLRVDADVCANSWQPVASVHLEPGDWAIVTEGDAYYTILPLRGPRP